MKLPSPMRVLGACGLLSSGLAAVGGFTNTPVLLGTGGAVMVVGNLYAVFKKT